MALLDIRQRTGYLFVAALLGNLILISTQVSDRSGVRVIDAVAFGVVSQFQRVTSSAVDGAVGLWLRYVALQGVQRDNDVLRRQVEALQVELQEQHALVQRSRDLRALLGIKESIDLTAVAAEIIAAGATPWFRTVTIDKGARDGLRADMAVIASVGVVGRIVGEPAARTAKVQLLIDRNAAVGAIVERSRAQGIVVGGETNSLLQMEYVSNLTEMKVGDLVMTSGIDGIYPKGFAIGTVVQVEPGAGLYRTIRVQPAVDFSKLEEVLVVTSPLPASQTMPEGEG